MDVEICASSIQAIKIACDSGANRIELCSGISIGGITPSQGLIELAIRNSTIPIHCLIRPREGHFIYNKSEFLLMLKEIKYARKNGMKGIVIGVMTKDYKIDIDQLKIIKQEAEDMEITFHRAFDSLLNIKEGINNLSLIGVNRILSSGRANIAIEGINNLIEWKSLLPDSISIQPGGGINEKSAIEFKKAGFQSIHLSGTISEKWNHLISKDLDQSFINQPIKLIQQDLITKIISIAKK
tara:strand:+ start:21422 stop:22141 length:720 start_codon:yes stop_codon:yes gene_type:complete